ncbi:hypothetical protein PA25_04880 [Pseudoalteromonas sp. A25]|uniref:hypothetical protein n=1 Tax=Pseudoalteromonas sp. A25 TaxID=116092 RepID=UPI0012607BBD|nr:hypothetical protein [Pseudoalteromonas sp. A25]BBN80503.1 hypothetical protein PA25_04880 [Pseudoalteromonas sp. A25]
MKLSNLILFTIASIAFFYIQLWDDRIVTPLYLFLLGFSTIYGVYTKNINMAHIAGFIFILTGISHIIFETGLINEATPEENKLLQGTLIYGTQLLISLLIAIVLIFRVQTSRALSKSKNIELTHFDGVFHWIFIYMAAVNLLALLENIAWSYFELKSWTLIYDNFEGLIYIAWALCCGALLTMMICSKKPTEQLAQ